MKSLVFIIFKYFFYFRGGGGLSSFICSYLRRYLLNTAVDVNLLIHTPFQQVLLFNFLLLTIQIFL